MIVPLTLPIPPSTLSAIIREEWEGERGCARLAGADPGQVGVETHIGGAIVAWMRASGRACDERDRAALRALSSLADRLEHRGVVVSREGGVRVIGWAVAASEWRDPGSKVVRLRGSYVVAVRHLDAIDPRRIAYDAEVMRAQEERRGKESAPRGSAGTVDRGRMAMGRRTT